MKEYNKLTDMEKCIFFHIVTGMTEESIAASTNYTIKEIMCRKQNLMVTLNCFSDAELFHYAAKNNLIEKDS